MKSFWTLLKREFWEHKKSVVWFPAGLMLIMLLFMLLMGSSTAFIKAKGMAMFFVPAFVLVATMPLVILGHAQQSISQERADKSLLFWRSMPISDSKAIVGKATFSLLGIPLCFIGWLLVFFVLSLPLFPGVELPMEISHRRVALTYYLILAACLIPFTLVTLPYYAYVACVASFLGRSAYFILFIPIIALFWLQNVVHELEAIIHLIIQPFELALKVCGKLMILISEFMVQTFNRELIRELDELGLLSKRSIAPFNAEDATVFVTSLLIGFVFYAIAVWARKRLKAF